MGKATSVNQGVRREPAGSGAETKTQTLSGRRAPGVARSAEGHHTRRVTVLSGHEEDTADAMSPFQGKEDGAGRTSERPGWSLPCPSAGPGVGTELGGGGRLQRCPFYTNDPSSLSPPGPPGDKTDWQVCVSVEILRAQNSLVPPSPGRPACPCCLQVSAWPGTPCSYTRLHGGHSPSPAGPPWGGSTCLPTT